MCQRARNRLLSQAPQPQGGLAQGAGFRIPRARGRGFQGLGRGWGPAFPPSEPPPQPSCRAEGWTLTWEGSKGGIRGGGVTLGGRPAASGPLPRSGGSPLLEDKSCPAPCPARRRVTGETPSSVKPPRSQGTAGFSANPCLSGETAGVYIQIPVVPQVLHLQNGNKRRTCLSGFPGQR